MYAQHFGLAQDPFSIAPDPRYLFMSERHREALAHLLYGLGGGGGFVLLSGEIGTGKTTVCRCFLEQIPDTCNVAYIFNPKLTVGELMQTVCAEFGIAVGHQGPGAPTVKECIDPLNAFLLAAHAAGRNNVLIIDEAQNLSAELLEQLRLLTNLETNERKLLQIVLIGQPELRDLLARPELEQLAQRVIARFHLDALSQQETRQYISHRLTVAGLQGASPFDAGALKRIHQLARGVPRRINLLCGRAMLGAYATGVGRIDSAIVDKAASEVFGKEGSSASARKERTTGLVLGTLAGAVLAGLVVWALNPAQRAAVSAATGPAPAGVPASAAVRSPLIAKAGLAVVVPLPPADLAAALKTFATDKEAAWRELAGLWKLPTGPGSACEVAARNGAQCFQGKAANPEFLRQLGRPVILTLYDENERAVHPVMSALGPTTVVLQIGGAPRTIPLAMLAGLWRGEFATYWRAPPGYTGKIVAGDSGSAVDWLAARLAALDGRSAPPTGRQSLDTALRARLQAFQRSKGLAPDGRAGPLTLMHLNRASSVDEPRLLVVG
jgi:general secretion pathway protein A